MSPASVAQSVLDPAGPAAVHISRLWWLMFWVSTAVFVITMAFLAIAIVRHRRARHTLTSPPVQIPGHRDETKERALGGAVAMAVVATAVILLVLLVASMQTGRAVGSIGAPSAVTIEITGYQ